MALTAERLRDVLSYDPNTGRFVWLGTLSNRNPAGSEAGCLDEVHGYRLIGIEGSIYKASRLAWFYMTGEWPAALVDHRNTVKSDDRWENLREATVGENLRNRGVQKNNLSGFKGVSGYAGGKKWTARISLMGKTERRNGFDTAEAAAAVYAEMAKRLHGEFART